MGSIYFETPCMKCGVIREHHYDILQNVMVHAEVDH